jgi:NAD(P)-dependent dehydrogenase (short-subunit alcohol dehydrogenase family)
MTTLMMPEEEWTDILDTNLTGTLRACQIFGVHMLSGRRNGRPGMSLDWQVAVDWMSQTPGSKAIESVGLGRTYGRHTGRRSHMTWEGVRYRFIETLGDEAEDTPRPSSQGN